MMNCSRELEFDYLNEINFDHVRLTSQRVNGLVLQHRIIFTSCANTVKLGSQEEVKKS